MVKTYKLIGCVAGDRVMMVDVDNECTTSTLRQAIQKYVFNKIVTQLRVYDSLVEEFVCELKDGDNVYDMVDALDEVRVTLIDDPHCRVCRRKLLTPCMDCYIQGRSPCYTVTSTHGDALHHHCVSRWKRMLKIWVTRKEKEWKTAERL